jgi:hypothetical protein
MILEFPVIEYIHDLKLSSLRHENPPKKKTDFI